MEDLFRCSGVPKHTFGEMREKLIIREGYVMWDTGVGIKKSWPVQNLLISTRKCATNLIFMGGMRVKKTQQIRPTK